MGVLDLEGPEDSAVPSHSARKRSNLKKGLIGAGGIAAVAGIGSTLAANINLNNSAPVEFGQGVTQTVACDEDGFTITPVSYYDNSSSSYRLDYVQISGLDLTPKGTQTSDGSVYGDSTAVAAHPGQYYDSTANTWKHTCDGVVLDFKMYTNDATYSKNTVDGYIAQTQGNQSPSTISSPLMWWILSDQGVVSQSSDSTNSDVAVAFNSKTGSGNTGTLSIPLGGDIGQIGHIIVSNPGDPGGTGFVASSSFNIFTDYGHHNASNYGQGPTNTDPTTNAISKFTVESMNFFPTNYNVQHSDSSYPGIRP